MSIRYTTAGRVDRRRLAIIALVLLLGLLIAWAVWNYLGGRGEAPGSTTTTSPGTTTAAPVEIYPTGALPDGFDLIVVEDHVEVYDDTYRLIVEAYGTFKSVVAYGGSSVSGNITNGQAAIKYGNYLLPVVAFASTNGTIEVDYPGMQVRLNSTGGYVLYTTPKIAVYYRYLTFNISGLAVFVWLPATSLPTKLTPDAEVHIYIDPVYGYYYANGVPYPLTYVSPRKQYTGILRAWLVETAASGTYTFTINP